LLWVSLTVKLGAVVPTESDIEFTIDGIRLQIVTSIGDLFAF
jgi:hypothetical protein